MQRLKNIICHPSRIGLYHKDSPLMIILYLFLFLSFMVGMLALKTFNTDYFDYSDAEYVISLVESDKKEITTKYENGKLTGDMLTVKDEGIELYFLTGMTINKITNSGMIVLLEEDNAKVYYKYSYMGTIEYKNLDSNMKFSINGIRSFNSDDIYNFRAFLYITFTSINTSYAKNVFITNIVRILEYYLIFAILVLMVFSYFINPGIRLDVRAKLGIYDSLIYFIIMFLSFAFEAQFLQYVALIIPIIYCNVTFSHIIRVKVGK